MKAKLPGVLLALSVALCGHARAETWYFWIDREGISHFESSAPLSTNYELVEIPETIRWRYPPEMPAEVGSDQTSTTKNLFRLASQSVYQLLGRHSTGIDDPQPVVHGSAVAITETLAITNCHVVAAAGEDMYIGSSDPHAIAKAEIEAANYLTDRCVVRVRGMRLRPTAGIRRYDALEIGETVYAIGNPQRMERTLSDGLVSGKREFSRVRYVQTTAPISPGSSGGGLFDTHGNLVAITSMSLKGAQNINFAIPAEDFWK